MGIQSSEAQTRTPLNGQDEKVVRPSSVVETVAPLDGNTVDFTDDDPENPVNWTTLRKWTVANAVASVNFISVLATCTIIPAAPQALEAMRSDSTLYRTLLVSIWELGEGISPFFVAPLSERYGRLPVFHIGNLFAVVWGSASALSVNISMLIAFRFLSGCVNTALTLAACFISDLFVLEERGKVMAMAMGTQIIGNFIAPICGSFIAQAMGWRWTIWINVISFGTIGILCLLIVRETYAVKILKGKTDQLRKSTGNNHLQSKYQARVDATTFFESFSSPLQIMVLSPTVLLVSLYTAVVYGTCYIISTTLTEVMEKSYLFSRGVVGLAFLGGAIGNVIGMLFYAMTSDAYIKRKKTEEGLAFRVEHRLAHLVLSAILLPLGFILYGWTLEFNVRWIVPLIGTGIIGFCNTIIIVATENYLIDAYSVQSASAIATGVILRAIAGAVYPLLGPSLYARLGLGWGNTVLALVLAAFLPFLVFLFKYGEKLRVKDRYAID